MLMVPVPPINNAFIAVTPFQVKSVSLWYQKAAVSSIDWKEKLAFFYFEGYNKLIVSIKFKQEVLLCI